MELSTVPEQIQVHHRYVWNIRELIRWMTETSGAHYANWGLCEKNDNFFFGVEDTEATLLVPLLDITELADKTYSDYGYSELRVLLQFSEHSYNWWIEIGR